MTNWLITHLVQNSNDISNPKVRERFGVLAGMVGVTSNFILFLIKFTTGFFFKSIAIMADAVNNLSDAGSSIITLVGFKLSGKPADAEHPYGHARMEYLSGLMVSFIIIFLGLQLIGSSFGKIIKPDDVAITPITYCVLIVSIIIKLWQSRFNKTLGKKIGSTALEATAADSLNDVFATSAVLVSAIIMQLTGIKLDGWMGLAVALFITVSGIKLVMETANPLLGLAPSAELIKTINDRIMSYDGVIGLHDLAIHNYGPDRCFASVHAEVPASQDILVSHDVIDNIERDFLSNMNIHMVIHLDPVVNDNEEINQLHVITHNIIKKISSDLSMHDFRVVFGSTHSNLLFDVVVPPSFGITDSELCHMIEVAVKELDSSLYTVITVDHNYSFIPGQEDN